MKNLLTPCRMLAIPMLLAAWGCGRAESLGLPVAQAWLGQPLQLTVPAHFDAADASEPCVHADVFYGDTRLPAGRVRTTLLGSPQEQRRIRIEAETPVDEPVVTVSLRAGCRNAITRQYTLLPEVASEQVLAQLARHDTVAAAAAPLRLARPAKPSVPAAAQVAREDVAVPHVRAKDAPPHRPRAVPAVHRQVAAAPAPRLKLEPLAIEMPPVLRVSADLAEPAGDPGRRAAAALLWKAINADPQEVLRTTVLLHQLETELAQVRRSAGQTHAEVLALRQRLDARPATPPLPAGWLQALVAACVAAAAVAGTLWWRGRGASASAEPWYAPAQDPALDDAPDEAGEVREVHAPFAARVVPPGPEATAPVMAQPAAAVSPAGSDAAASNTIDLELPEPAAPRTVTGALRVETLAATLEEVEFLASLGLTSDAGDVLKAYIEDAATPAPLAFFQLMLLCEQEGDAQALAAVRRRYQQLFGVEGPRVEQLAAPLGVERMPELSARITQAWQRDAAADVIEAILFGVPAPGAPLTVQAGRELVALHDLAMALATERGAAPQADAHPLAPWAHAEDAAEAQVAAQAVADADGGRHFALDVDLDAAPQPLPEKTVSAGERRLALREEKQAALEREAQRAAAERTRAQDEEDAFSAAVAFERVPASRY